MLAFISLRYNDFLASMSCSPAHEFWELMDGVCFIPLAPTQSLGPGTERFP